MTIRAIPATPPAYHVLICHLPNAAETDHREIDPDTHDLRADIIRQPVVAWRVSDSGATRPVTPSGSVESNRYPDPAIFGILYPDGQVLALEAGQFDGLLCGNESDFIAAARNEWERRIKRERKEQANEQ